MTYLHEIFYTEAPGQANTKIKLDELELIFKVTKAIQNGFCSICKEIFDVITYPHQIRYTEATGQDKGLNKILKVALSYSFCSNRHILDPCLFLY